MMTRRAALNRSIVRAVVAIVLALCAGSASAQQDIGVRAGVSGDPTQFYFGGHFESAPLVDRLTFRPNVELGLGDDRTLLALNVEFVYRIRIASGRWDVYLGGGPAAVVRWWEHHDGDTDVSGGFNFLVGLAHRDGLFVELKVGAIDSPSIKFGVGYAFGL